MPSLGCWSLVVLLAVLPVALAYPSKVYGVDVSESYGSGAMSCLVSNNLTFAVVRGYQSVGRPDPNAPGTIAAAWAGGMQHVDFYIFPCPTCGASGSSQVQSAISALRNSKWGMIWFDIEGPQYWHSSQATNRAFFEDMLNGAHAAGATVGIYTSASQWEPIMGSSYTGGSGYPLWYAHYDGVPGFGDFQPFGGWTRPSIKQFSDQGSKCGVSYDINWYPE